MANKLITPGEFAKALCAIAEEGCAKVGIYDRERVTQAKMTVAQWIGNRRYG